MQRLYNTNTDINAINAIIAVIIDTNVIINANNNNAANVNTNDIDCTINKQTRYAMPTTIGETRPVIHVRHLTQIRVIVRHHTVL